MKNDYDKVVKEGKVAVLYLPNYGAGWYSCNTDRPEILFNPAIVNLVLEEDKLGDRETRDKDFCDKVDKIIKDLYGDVDFYTGGARNLEVCWVHEGEQFEVVEYDGYESVNVIGECQYLIA